MPFSHPSLCGLPCRTALAWYLYYRVTQNILRLHEKRVYRRKKIRFESVSLHAHLFLSYQVQWVLRSSKREISRKTRNKLCTMVLIWDGNSEIGAHTWRNLGYFIRLRHLFRSRAVTNRILFLQKSLFSFICAQHYLSYHLT